MSDLSITEKRLLAVALVAGNVNFHEFNALCNTDDMNRKARQRALDSLLDNEILVARKGTVRVDA